jgi:2-phospho-L-lactate guanylyltransferase
VPWSERPATCDAVTAWRLVVPVKRLSLAKTRLALSDDLQRARLALAFALDTVAAALRCELVDGVLVVTDDPVAAARLRNAGADVVSDEPDAGQNPAIAHGASRVRADSRDHAVAALSADLPALRAGELRQALEAAAQAARAFVPDASDEGTTLLTAGPGTQLVPEFGHGSSARHRRAGALDIVSVAGSALPSLRRDVDTMVDLRQAVDLGLGQHSSGVLDDLVGIGALPAMDSGG